MGSGPQAVGCGLETKELLARIHVHLITWRGMLGIILLTSSQSLLMLLKHRSPCWFSKKEMNEWRISTESLFPLSYLEALTRCIVDHLWCKKGGGWLVFQGLCCMRYAYLSVSDFKVREKVRDAYSVRGLGKVLGPTDSTSSRFIFILIQLP